MGLKNPNTVENDLHRLLLRAVPTNALGNKTINHLATLIPCTRSAITKWIRLKRITPERAIRLVEIGKLGEPFVEGGRVTKEDLDPFVYNV